MPLVIPLPGTISVNVNNRTTDRCKYSQVYCKTKNQIYNNVMQYKLNDDFEKYTIIMY